MENLFQNTTLLNKDVYFEFNKFHFCSWRFYKQAYIFILVMSTLLVVMGVLELCNVVKLKGDGGWSCLVGFGFMAYALLLWRLPKLLTNRLLKTDKRLRIPIENEYAFEEECLRASYAEGNVSFQYSNLYKVSESDTYFYLYINSMMAYIVSKADFTLGTPEQFRSFMMGKMGKKFYNKTTKKKRN